VTHDVRTFWTMWCAGEACDAHLRLDVEAVGFAVPLEDLGPGIQLAEVPPDAVIVEWRGPPVTRPERPTVLEALLADLLCVVASEVGWTFEGDPGDPRGVVHRCPGCSTALAAHHAGVTNSQGI
jgi:hypothetical protein